MNKSDLIRAIANKTGYTINEATKAFDAVIDVITENLVKGEKVQISGFGTFETKSKPAREGANPKTGEKIQLEPSVTPIFKFGKAYKDSFNK
jgi:DNA-binding protein HU-beta